MQLLGRGIAHGGCAVEEVEVQRPMLDALAQHVNHPAFADLSRKPGEQFEAVNVLRVIGVRERQFRERRGLRGTQESEELRHIERMGAVVVLRAAGGIAGAAVRRLSLGNTVRRHAKAIRPRHVAHDQGFESFFAGVGFAHDKGVLVD